MTLGAVTEPGEIESMVSQARERARAAVMDELVTGLTRQYRQAVSARLGTAGSDPHSSVDSPVETACCVYAVARRDEVVGLGLADLVGVEDRPVTLVQSADLAAVAASVPLERFRALGAPEGEPDLGEGGWLAAAVRAHERVVERVFTHATVLPFRFGALYRSPEDVAAVLAEHGGGLDEELRRLDGTAEWGVRAYLEGNRGVAEVERCADGGGVTGTEWMRLRREEAALRSAARQARHVVAEDVHEVLARRARDCVVRPHPRRDTADVPVLDGAYLYGRGDEARIAADTSGLSQRHAGSGLRLQVSGPWPPYHFVRLPERVGHG